MDGRDHRQMTQRPYNVLFLCTGNSARSIIAEATLNAMAHGRFQGFSAGSHPGGRVNPLVLDFLREKNLPASDARSKSWDEFAVAGAPRMDLIITVCDSAAGEACPIWPGHPVTAHWGVEDPAAHMDDPAKARKVIERREAPDYVYDPRTRGWYQKAIAEQRQVRTEPYVFFTTGDVGLTFARRSSVGDAAVGADLTLRDLRLWR